MAEIKDKIVSVEDLSALHEYNKKSYMPIGTTAEDIGAYDKEDVYTKAEVYSKEEIYTKAEVDELIRIAIEEIMEVINAGSEEPTEPTE